ncbi:MAG: tannase/feruloyl esterase family alpha/beta hydrolase [Sphingobium sp.]|nr:tannase/feruloyl esterase family alpha/beta hydrolase [Sphingobium sp.]
MRKKQAFLAHGAVMNAGMMIIMMGASHPLSAQNVAAHSASAPVACNDDAARTQLGVDTARARTVAATDGPSAPPAYCEISATLSPVEGSAIGVVYRLPNDWNGKMLGLGGGGWAGNVTIEAASAGLRAGYATAQTDGGHADTSPWQNEWTANPIAATDFSWRAIHEMTQAGKKLVTAYYGKAQDKAYFHGCSTGGRMALMEAQRFPDDYDAIISAAPVYSLQVQTSAVLRNNAFAVPGAGLDASHLKLVNNAVLAACDAKDGVTDGIIASPRQCAWDPSVLSCKAGQTDGCLSAPQIKALRIAYDGIRAPDGSWAQTPLSRGGELGWPVFIAVQGSGADVSKGGGMPGLSRPLFGVDGFDYGKLDPAKDVLRARSSAFAKTYEAINPDLSPFFARGGKLLMWHGESDPGPAPIGTIDYVEAVHKNTPAASGNLRMFLAPGVEHCRGGPGTDQIDVLSALDHWVSSGTAPETLVATRADGKMTRPLCVWPLIARYQGKGDVNDPAHYSCVRAISKQMASSAG